MNDEHWLAGPTCGGCHPGNLVFARLGWPPNAVTGGFIACGVAAGAVAALGGLGGAIAAAVLSRRTSCWTVRR